MPSCYNNEQISSAGAVCMQYGIDVSSNNHVSGNDINWPAAYADLRKRCDHPFVMIKVTEGTNYVNPYWYWDRMGAHAAGFLVGLYHFCRPSDNSGHAEAEFFQRAIGKVGGILKGESEWGDIEDTRVATYADLLAYLLDFLGTLSRPLGCPAGRYSGEWYMRPHNLWNRPELKDFPLWYADYSTSQPTLGENDPILVWQNNCHGQVDGIPTEVDLNVFNGTVDDWNKYAWGMQPSPIANQPIDVKPDVSIAANNETLSGAGTIFQKIGQDALAIVQGGDAITLAQKIKADADLGVQVTWGH